MVVRVTGCSPGVFLQLSSVDGGCIQWLDLKPAPWASWELHATGGILASAYGSHGVAPPPQVKRQFLFPWTSCGLGTLRFELLTMALVLSCGCKTSDEALQLWLLDLGASPLGGVAKGLL